MNPNTVTRLTSWPVTVRSSIRREVRDEILEIIVTAMEKFHWDTKEIPNYLKRELDRGCAVYALESEGMEAEVRGRKGK